MTYLSYNWCVQCNLITSALMQFLDISLRFINLFALLIYQSQNWPLLITAFPDISACHAACLDLLILCSSILTHCLLPCAELPPSPTMLNLVNRTSTLAQMVAVEI